MGQLQSADDQTPKYTEADMVRKKIELTEAQGKAKAREGQLAAAEAKKNVAESVLEACRREQALKADRPKGKTKTDLALHYNKQELLDKEEADKKADADKQAQEQQAKTQKKAEKAATKEREAAAAASKKAEADAQKWAEDQQKKTRAGTADYNRWTMPSLRRAALEAGMPADDAAASKVAVLKQYLSKTAPAKSTSAKMKRRRGKEVESDDSEGAESTNFDDGTEDNDSNKNEDDDPNNDWCTACDGQGNLLCCDGCEHAYHGDCLDPKVDPDLLDEDTPWFCAACLIKRMATSPPRRSGRGHVDKAPKLTP